MELAKEIVKRLSELDGLIIAEIKQSDNPPNVWLKKQFLLYFIREGLPLFHLHRESDPQVKGNTSDQDTPQFHPTD